MQISFECDQCGRFYKVDEDRVGQAAACVDCGEPLRVPVPAPISNESTSNESTQLSEHEEADPAELVVADLNASIGEHIEKHIGPVHRVWHEINPSPVQVDIVQVAPTDERPFWTMVTLGMSHQPMQVPDDARDYGRAELVLCLPQDWPIEEHDLRSERNYWPIGLLKALASLPVERGTWIGPGHTIPNGEQLQPYTHSTEMCCSLILPPVVQLPEDFHILKQPNGQVVRFYSVWTLYPEEVQLKINRGLDVLLQKLHKNSLTETVSPDRKNVARKSPWKFWQK
jgi:hypothetical protein